MQRQFERELEEIKTSVLAMAGKVERNVADATTALVECDAELAKTVIQRDEDIDRHEVEIDRLTTEFIVRHQPAASDLRFVVAAIKLGPELERIGDHAVNTAERTLELCGKPMIKPLIDLPRMLNMARAMVSDAITAYINRDAESAREIIERDDRVDESYEQLLRELLTFMIENPNTITQAMGLIFVGRYAERIADQATNICEEVVYIVEGEPIRHQHLWE